LRRCTIRERIQSMKPACSISIERDPRPEDIHLINEGLRAYNRRFAPDDHFSPLVILLRDRDQTLVGGLLGTTYWGWLHIDILWLTETVRRQGYGQKLVETAEQEARQRGCRAAHLDTMSFQALGFYEKLGYQVFGVLEDLPAGHSRYFMKKALD
jgi:GNAT superfamily N-acetyltransferase